MSRWPGAGEVGPETSLRANPTLAVSSGRVEAAVLLRTADRAGHLLGTGPAADAERHLCTHHQALPLLPDGRQGLAGAVCPGPDSTTPGGWGLVPRTAVSCPE